MLTELEQRADTEARHAHRELVDQADARVAAAYEAAADVLLDRGTNVEDPIAVRKDILALITDDAQTALTKMLAEARAEGMREAAKEAYYACGCQDNILIAADAIRNREKNDE